jgi:hypothetical protein
MSTANHQPPLHIRPITLKAAAAFVKLHHRHNIPDRGGKFAIAAHDGECVRGVAVCGRPKGRMLDDGFTLEITRVASDGCPNACSKLYSASRRVGQAMGYTKFLTYTRADEPGTSLIAAGWEQVALIDGRSWDTPSRRRQDKTDVIDRWRWQPA